MIKKGPVITITKTKIWLDQKKTSADYKNPPYFSYDADNLLATDMFKEIAREC